MTVGILRTDEEFREFSKYKQYIIPTKLYYKIRNYKYIPWVVVTDLYEICVREVLLTYNVELLLDISFGKGYVEVYKKFFELLEKANETYKGE